MRQQKHFHPWRQGKFYKQEHKKITRSYYKKALRKEGF